MSGGEKDALSAVEIDRINYLNIVLMVVSLAVATYLPFETFIFAYAFLGPLHYLTEISWLHDRAYFARRPSIVWWFLPAVLLVVASYLSRSPEASRLSLLLVSVMVVVSAAFAFSSSRIAYELCVVMGIVVGYVSFNYEPLSTFLLVLLPTLIHVCVFTGIFIVYGALKGKSVSGVLSAVVYLVCPLISVYGLTTPSTYQVSDYYLDSTVPFEAVGLAMVRLLGLPESRESWLAFMRLMAFAYSYHYLNWFSKTRVINWHRTSRRRLSAIGILYLVSIAIYSYDFVTGYVVLLTLSLVHVVLELPLNYLSMIGVFKELRRYSGSKAQ